MRNLAGTPGNVVSLFANSCFDFFCRLPGLGPLRDIGGATVGFGAGGGVWVQFAAVRPGL